MKRLVSFLALAAFGASLVFSPGRAWASEVDALLNKLVQKGILSNEEAQEVRNEMAAEAESAAASRSAEIKDVAKGMAGGGWLDTVKWGGDFRLRSESIMRQPSVDRQRERFRLRFGFTAKPWKPLEVGVQLASGASGDPLATNQSFGATFDKKAIFIDKAYAKYTPWFDLSGILSGMSFTGGKMDNPFVTIPEGLVWDSDVTPEGVAMQWKDPNPLPGLSSILPVKPFINIGAFALSELNGDEGDPGLFGYQGGADIALPMGWGFQPAAAVYNFTGVKTATANIAGSPAGNTTSGGRIVSDFLPVVVQAKLSHPDILFGQPVALLADYTHNEDDKNADVNVDDDGGYVAGLEIGKVTEKFGSWKAFFFRRRIESDATFGALTDSDFGGGGTNHKGYILGAQMGLNKWASLGVKYLRTDEIEGAQNKVDTFQADLQLKY